MKKILIFTENHQPGGLVRYVMDTANALAGSYGIVIASNKNALSQSDYGQIEGVYSTETVNFLSVAQLTLKAQKNLFLRAVKAWFFLDLLHSSPIIKFLHIKTFTALLNRVKPDLVISFNGGYPAARSCINLCYAAKKLNIPAVLSTVSMPSPNWYNNRIYGDINKTVPWFSVNAGNIKTALAKLKNINPGKIKLLYNCVKQEDFLSAKPAAQMRKLLNIPENKTVFVFAGRLERMKGVYLLYDAFLKARKQAPNMHLVLAGKNIDGDIFYNYIKEGIDNGWLTLTGHYKGNIYDIINMADIFVMPSYWEGLPYVLIEAMQCAKPVIASDVGGIPELIKNGENGYLFNPNNCQQLEQLLENAALNAKNLQNLGENAAKTVKENFMFSSFKQKINAFVQSITG